MFLCRLLWVKPQKTIHLEEVFHFLGGLEPTSFQLIISGQWKLHLGWKYHQLEDFKRCGIPSLQLNTSGSAGVLWKSHRIWQDTTRSIDSYIASWIVHRYISDVWWKLLLIDTLSPWFQKWTEFFHLWRHPFLIRCYPGYPKKTCKTMNSFVSAAGFFQQIPMLPTFFANSIPRFVAFVVFELRTRLVLLGMQIPTTKIGMNKNLPLKKWEQIHENMTFKTINLSRINIFLLKLYKKMILEFKTEF